MKGSAVIQCYRCIELEAQGLPEVLVCPVCGTEDATSHKSPECAEVEPMLMPKAGIAEGVTGRHGFAHKFATWLEANNLKPSSQCIVERDSSKKYYRVCWSVGLGEMGGEVRIYGREWIAIFWDGDVEYMPMKGSRIFDSDFVAEQFMISAFIKQNWQHAQLCPERQTKRTKE